ncbi:MAG: type I secretion system permease/ATPase, partial [Moraxellaceae bacterium]
MLTQQTGTLEKGGPLLECLLIITRAHGILTTAETLLAGLPLQHNQLTPSSFARSAKRAGLTSSIVARDLLQLNDALFPVILLLNNNSACVL